MEKEYIVKVEDIKKRVYFIINLIQSQKSSTMQGALTSKSDSMGGIFDRFINSLTEDIVFDKLLLPLITTNSEIEFIKDYYLYNPSKNGAGIAPDIFGLKINDKLIPFTKFNEKWCIVNGMPQIEVKTFKEKDQMVSLRNQDCEGKFLVLVDLALRIDYLVPFLNKDLLNDTIVDTMNMDDSVFVEKDSKSRLKKITTINYSFDDIGKLTLLAITNGEIFIKSATLCGGKISPQRMKEIKERKAKVKNSVNLKLSEFSKKSDKLSKLYQFNKKWYKQFKINTKKVVCLDFCAKNIKNIEIVYINKNSIVITGNAENCMFNGQKLEKGKQYTVKFETLDRSSNTGEEYFMQKQCVEYLESLQPALLKKLTEIIEKNEKE